MLTSPLLHARDEAECSRPPCCTHVTRLSAHVPLLHARDEAECSRDAKGEEAMEGSTLCYKYSTSAVLLAMEGSTLCRALRH